jgi:hypothetical protein
MKVGYHVFKDFKLERAGATDEEIIAARSEHADEIRRLRYSFVSICRHPGSGSLFLGATNGGGDLLVEFDPVTGEFSSKLYAESDSYQPPETKIHKGLWLDGEEDALYFGTAALGGLPVMMATPGGALVRYSIAEGSFELLARPIPGDFFQATCLDRSRERIYGWTIRGCFVVFDTEKRERVRYETMESTPHIGCIDDDGGVWGVWGINGAFYHYLPDEDRFEFPEGCVFHNGREASNVMYTGAGPVDSFMNGGDGFLYVGSALGEFYRLDPRAGKLEYLGKPFPGQRLPGMAVGEDGWIYLCGGKRPASMLARYHREEKRFEHLGVVEHSDGTRLSYCHDLCVIGNTVYAGETDNPTRSGYLWTCEL